MSIASILTILPNVTVALARPPGYEDVHPELVVIDALHSNQPWPHEIIRDDGEEVVIELERPDGYERADAHSLAREAIQSNWTKWRIIAAGNK